MTAVSDIISDITPPEIEDDERKKERKEERKKFYDERKKMEKFAEENNIPFVETLKFDTLAQMKKHFFNEQIKRRNDLIKSARIPKIYTDIRAKDFIITEKNELAATTAIKSVTENNGLFIYGECGTGKTMLASIIANERAEIFKPSMFIRAVDIFHELNPHFSENKLATVRKRNLLLSTPCVIIDDLGAEKPSDFTRATLFDIIDHRMNEGLQTIITTNFNINELKNRLNAKEELNLSDKIIRRIKATCQLIELNHY